MRKLLLALCLTLTCNIAFAEVGPLTRAMQEEFAKTGQCYFKYYDYSLSKLMNSFSMNKTTLKPSAIVEYAKGKAFEASKRKTILRNAHLGENNFFSNYWYFVKDNKYYSLNLDEKEGIRKDLEKTESNDTASVGLLPDALVLTLPEEMRNSSMKLASLGINYKGTKNETVNGETFQCETYETSSGMPKGLLPFSDSKGQILSYKLYFKNGKLIRLTDPRTQGEYTMISYSNSPDDRLATVPKGYIIYADNSKSMGGLLKEKIVLERH